MIFEKYLTRDRVEIDRIPLNSIIENREKLLILFPHNNLDELDKFFLHLTGKTLTQTNAKIVLAFESPVHVNFTTKHDIVISNNYAIYSNHRNAADHIIVFDEEESTVTHLIPTPVGQHHDRRQLVQN